MALQKDFVKDDPADKTPESKNTRLSAALVSAAFLKKGIVLIERVEEGETGWTVYSHG